MDISIPLKNENDIVDAVEHFNKCVQSASWESTPISKPKINTYTFPKRITDLIALKREARKKGSAQDSR
ncbi:hypothetical protein, partial [Vibrio alginolyticus]|uniref:hypothetical protein n=1 Tax=Vibrio alginolyticus TaxID=663 RepID=UPI001A8F9AF6